MLPEIFLLVALINIGAKLNNYNIKNHPLDIRVRRDLHASIENLRNVIKDEENNINQEDNRKQSRFIRNLFKNPEEYSDIEGITKVLAIDPKKINAEVEESGKDLNERVYNNRLMRLLYPNERKTSNREVQKNKRSVDNKVYNNQGINNTGNGYIRHLAPRNNTGVRDSNIMSLYARKPYQYNSAYNKANQTSFTKPSNTRNGSNSQIYRANLQPNVNVYQRGPHNNFTNNTQPFNNNNNLPNNNQFVINNIVYNQSNNNLFNNNNGYDPNRNIHFKNNRFNNNNMLNNSKNNGYDSNRNINFNSNNMYQNNNAYDPNRNINFNSNNLYQNNNAYDPNRNINFNNNPYNNNNRYDSNRKINFNNNNPPNTDLLNNNAAYDPNRNINFNNNPYNNNNLYYNNNGYDPNRNINFNNNLNNKLSNSALNPNNNNNSSNNKLPNNFSYNPFQNQAAIPIYTVDNQGEPSTTTTAKPIIVESCFMCAYAGCPTFFRKVGFLCVPEKH